MPSTEASLSDACQPPATARAAVLLVLQALLPIAAALTEPPGLVSGSPLLRIRFLNRPSDVFVRLGIVGARRPASYAVAFTHEDKETLWLGSTVLMARGPTYAAAVEALRDTVVTCADDSELST